jgi:hypothetical protein
MEALHTERLRKAGRAGKGKLPEAGRQVGVGGDGVLNLCIGSKRETTAVTKYTIEQHCRLQLTASGGECGCRLFGSGCS